MNILKDFFSISEAAKIVGTTSETLRHYDRIGLVTPGKKDLRTNYRYYTVEDIVHLNTVRALQQMDLPLKEIKCVLEYNDLQEIVDYLSLAEKKADEKIALLQNSKSRILSAKTAYEKKLHEPRESREFFVKEFPARVLMLSDTLETPSLENLWNYLSHFFDRLSPKQKKQFTFEDVAGIYTENGQSRLFAVCIQYADISGLKILPKGSYLCAGCTEENRTDTLERLLHTAKTDYHAEPAFTIQQIVVSGILHWNYQIQIPLFTDS